MSVYDKVAGERDDAGTQQTLWSADHNAVRRAHHPTLPHPTPPLRDSAGPPLLFTAQRQPTTYRAVHHPAGLAAVRLLASSPPADIALRGPFRR